MADQSFALKVYTPAGLALDDKTSSVSVPASDGEIGVLSQHTKYTGLLGTGLLEYVPQGASTPKRVVISGGFCNFADEQLTILADSVDFPDTIPANYAAERQNLAKQIEQIDSFNPEWGYTKQKLERIEAIDRLKGVH